MDDFGLDQPVRSVRDIDRPFALLQTNTDRTDIFRVAFRMWSTFSRDDTPVNFAVLDNRSILGRLVRAPLRLIPRNLVVRVLSGVNRGLKWTVGASVHGCWLGHFESEKQETLGRFVRPGLIGFDVGANAGFYTLALSRGVGPKGHVWAFEPLAGNVATLLRHVDLNRLANVTVVQSAVAGGRGMIGFARAPSNSMGKIASTESAYLVPTVSLDVFCAERSIRHPDLIKIDVEGAEIEVLDGARGILSSSKPTILLSLHGPAQEEGCLRILEQYGYRLEYLDGRPALDRPLASDEIVAVASAGAS